MFEFHNFRSLLIPNIKYEHIFSERYKHSLYVNICTFQRKYVHIFSERYKHSLYVNICSILPSCLQVEILFHLFYNFQRNINELQSFCMSNTFFLTLLWIWYKFHNLFHNVTLLISYIFSSSPTYLYLMLCFFKENIVMITIVQRLI